MQKYLSSWLGRGDVFYDVGAHAGFFTVAAARLLDSSGLVFAFEPDPANASRLRKQLERNRLANTQVIESAAWSADQRVHFRRDGICSSRNTGSVCSDGSTTDVLEVQAVTLDEFARQNRAPTVVKIDVEGAELQVLRGMNRLLRESKPRIIVEVHRADTRVECRRYLNSFGYVVRQVGSGDEVPPHLVASPQSATASRLG